MRAAKIICLVFAIFMVVGCCYSQHGKNLFFHYTPEQGLIDNSVTCFLKDKNGFLWIGTNSGVSRFDGLRFTNYVCNPADSISLSGNHVVNLFEDTNGFIWLSTHENGLNAYDPTKNRFKRYKYNSKLKNGVPNNNPTAICTDIQGRMWVGFFGKGIALYDPKTETFAVTSFDSSEQLYNFNEIMDMKSDKEGIFWISTRVGLIRFDPISGLHQRFEQLEPNGLKRSEKNLFLKLKLGEDGNIYVGSWVNGIYSLNPKTMEWKQFLVDKIQREEIGYANKINDFTFITPNKILFTSYYFGFGFLNCITGEVDYISPNDQYSTRTIGSETGYCVYHVDNLSFLGTNSGFSRMRERSSAIREFDGTSLKFPFENGINVISSFIPTQNDSLLFAGTYYRNGLYSFSKKTRRLLSNIELENSEGQLIINWIHPSRSNDSRFYIASSKGLLLFESDKPDKLRRIQSLDASIRDGFIGALDMDSKGRLWISMSNRLVAWDENTGNLEDHSDKFMSLSELKSFRLIQIYIDRFDRIWCITDSRQLYVYDPLKGSCVPFNCETNGANILEGSAETVLQDAAGNMWISMSSTGLAFYNVSTGVIRYLTSKEGLLNARIVSLALDSDGNVWALSNKGLSIVNPSNFLIRNFTKRQGFELADANVIEFHKGQMYVGGRDYAWVISPSELLSTRDTAGLYITGISTVSKFFDNLNSNELVDSIVLTNSDHYFTIQFTVPDISSEVDYYYYTRIDGVDDDWVLQGTKGEVTYHNLGDGIYSIRIRAKDGSGYWCTAERAIVVTIEPPFWKKAWFFIPMFILIAGLFISVNKQRIRIIRRKAEERSAIRHQLTELENKALRSQMNPHFIFNSLNSINSYIIKNHTDEASAFVTKFARLIRLILDNSMDNMVLLERELMALSLYIEIESKRFEKKFSWEIDLEKNLQNANYWIPPMVIQPYVENAIWHGLLHKDSPGNLKVSVRLKDDCLEIQIRDNGVGRKAAIDFRSKTTLKTKSHGLEVTKKRIENFNEEFGITGSVSIIDLTDEEGNASGTLAILKLARVIKPISET